MNWDLIDREFSCIKDTTYLNICSTGPMPNSVSDGYKRFLDNRVNPYGENIMIKGMELLKSTKVELSKLLNCKVENIGMTTSTSEGMGIFIGGYPFESGDNIIISDQEFPSAIMGYIPLSKKGVRIKTVSVKNGYLDIEDFKNAIDAKTKAIVVSAVQFTSGFYIDLIRLGALCKMYSIHLIVDGIQAVGRLNIDVEKMNISFMSCGSFKGLLSSVGCGFIYCNQELLEMLTPISVSYTNAKYDFNPPIMNYDLNNLSFRMGARKFEAGHINYLGYAGLYEACRLINEIGIEKIETHILSLQHKLLESIKELNLLYMTPEVEENYSGIFSIYYPEELYDNVVSIMNKHKVIVTINENGYIRIGIGFYNKIIDIDNLVTALYEVADTINK